jgi:uncharacterized protein YlxP (DUF503 family)
MMLGTLQVELLIPGSFSLKDKRFVLQGLKTKIRSTFNVSVAEVDFHDKWQRTCVAFACVSADRRYLDSVFSKVLNAIDAEDRVEVVDQQVEIF